MCMHLLSPGKKRKQHADTSVSVLLFCHVHVLLNALLVILSHEFLCAQSLLFGLHKTPQELNP